MGIEIGKILYKLRIIEECAQELFFKDKHIACGSFDSLPLANLSRRRKENAAMLNRLFKGVDIEGADALRNNGYVVIGQSLYW